MNQSLMESRQSPARDETLLDGPAPQSTGPADWLGRVRAEGWRQYGQLPAPKRTDESWRFSDLKAIDPGRYRRPQPVDPASARAMVARSHPAADSGWVILANDHPLEEQPLPAALAARGVRWQRLDELAREAPELLERHFLAHSSRLGSDKFEALHRAHLSAGFALVVPDGVEILQPLEIHHWLSGQGASTFPHLMLVAGANSRVALLQHLRSAEADAPGFCCGVSTVHAGPGSRVTYVCAQQWNEATTSFQLHSVLAEPDASVIGLHLNLGGAYARVESRSKLAGPGSRSDMLALTVGHGTQQFDLRTFQEHAAAGTASDLLYKNALADRSRAIFSGLIRVDEGAHRTDAYQQNRSLLLSDEAESNSMPGLEILADDVRCTHGSTTSDIDPEEMFYLRARGIPVKVARQLIALGFFREVFERLQDETLAARLAPLAQGAFARA